MACGVCGSDLRILRYGHARVKPPAILGHEIAGEIVQVGADAPFQLGQRVAITPRISCGKCWYCTHDKYTYCPTGRSFGYAIPGGLAEYVLVPPEGIRMGVVNTFESPLSYEEAALAEPLACCLHGQRQSRLSKGDVVAIIGAGPIGLLHSLLAAAQGAASCILIERDPQRVAMAAPLAPGPVVDSSRSDPLPAILKASDGRGADVVIVAASATPAQEQALRFAAKGGRVNFFGGLPTGTPPIALDSNRVHYDEVSIHGSHGSTPEENRRALALLQSGAVAVKRLITHRFPLEDVERAIVATESKEGLKVVVTPQRGVPT
jgi:L-iditol 2-dehydrogenase